MAAAVTPQAEALARLAHEETGYGVVADKVQKNLFASEKVYRFIKPIKTVGVIQRLEDRKVIEIAEPFGVVCAIVPSTNPTSTAIYKILIAVKARCPIVISPHPAAVRCITRVAEIMNDAARKAGAPDGTINWMTTVTLEGTQELMKASGNGCDPRDWRHGPGARGLQRRQAAYGVGPGNAPAYIESSADIAKAAATSSPARPSTTVCSVRRRTRWSSTPPSEEVKRMLQGQWRVLHVSGGDRCGRPSPGQPAAPAQSGARGTPGHLHRQAGRHHGASTARACSSPARGRRARLPLSIEKLCPVLSFYVVKDWREGCERCKEILRYGGMGHTMSIHSRNDDIILQFGLKKPASASS